MKTCFIARTAEEVQQVFSTKFYEESCPKSQAELDERVQLAAFLRTYALSGSCLFPVEVNIPPRDQKPDFKVTFRGANIGIEATKIASWELEELRSVQRKEKLGTIEISSLLRQQPKRSRSQKIADCTASFPVFIFPDSNQMQHEAEFWLQHAAEIIRRKHEISRQPTFHHHGESWLLLWDKLSCGEELSQRIEILANWLKTFWDASCFGKVIIHQEHSERFFLLSRAGVEIIENEKILPTIDFSLPEGNSLGIDN